MSKAPHPSFHLLSNCFIIQSNQAAQAQIPLGKSYCIFPYSVMCLVISAVRTSSSHWEQTDFSGVSWIFLFELSVHVHSIYPLDPVASYLMGGKLARGGSWSRLVTQQQLIHRPHTLSSTWLEIPWFIQQSVFKQLWSLQYPVHTHGSMLGSQST